MSHFSKSSTHLLHKARQLYPSIQRVPSLCNARCCHTASPQTSSQEDKSYRRDCMVDFDEPLSNRGKESMVPGFDDMH